MAKDKETVDTSDIERSPIPLADRIAAVLALKQQPNLSDEMIAQIDAELDRLGYQPPKPADAKKHK